jgi:uncharacterized protein
MVEGTAIVRARWEIRPQDGSYPIRADLRALDGPAPRTAVVICHGFKGFREWAFFPALARAIALRGHAAVTFDFSRNGVGDDGVDFSALERFASNTHSRNLEEICLVVDAVAGSRLFPRPPEKIVLLGHSRGGAEAILAAARDERIAALVTWSAIASIAGRWSAEQVASWERGETVLIPNARTGQQMPVGPAYWRDVVTHRERLDVLAAAARLRIPWLIVHGEADETVPVAEARALAAAAPRADLFLVEGAGHTFGAAHPLTHTPASLRAVLQTTLGWLDEQLA